VTGPGGEGWARLAKRYYAHVAFAVIAAVGLVVVARVDGSLAGLWMAPVFVLWVASAVDQASGGTAASAGPVAVNVALAALHLWPTFHYHWPVLHPDLSIGGAWGGYFALQLLGGFFALVPALAGFAVTRVLYTRARNREG